MRELKFRIWHKTKKAMSSEFRIEDFILLGKANQTAILFSKLEEWWKDVILLQYTGLKDKNGKEIYEGDILLINYPYYKLPNGRNGIVVSLDMEYQYNDNKLRSNFYTRVCSFSGTNPDFWEVIGNIYENSELLDDNRT